MGWSDVQRKKGDHAPSPQDRRTDPPVQDSAVADNHVTERCPNCARLEFELANAKDLIRTMFRMSGGSERAFGSHASALAQEMRREAHEQSDSV